MKIRAWAAFFLVILTVTFGLLYLNVSETSYNNGELSKNTNKIIDTAKTTNYQGNPTGEESQSESAKKHFRKKLFNGAFIVTKNGSTITRAANGYANTNYYSNVNSLYNVGSLQFQINSAVFLRLMQKENINLNQKVKTVFPEMKSIGNVKLKDIVLNNNKLGLDQFTIKNKSFKSIMKKFNDIKIREYSSRRNITQNNSILLAILIQKSTNKNYYSVIKDELLDKIPTLNVAFKKNSKQKDNTLISRSYIYHVKDSDLQYDEPISNKTSTYLGANQMFMSVSDVFNCINYIFHSNYLNINNKKHFKTGLLASNGSESRGSYSIHTSYNGFITNILINDKKENGIVVLLNVDPGTTKVHDLMQYLVKHYNIDE